MSIWAASISAFAAGFFLATLRERWRVHKERRALIKMLDEGQAVIRAAFARTRELREARESLEFTVAHTEGAQRGATFPTEKPRQSS